VRLDLFLNTTRILRTRSLGKRACDLGFVYVNGRRAKASTQISPGNKIIIDLPIRFLEIEVIGVPAKKNISKKEAKECIHIIRHEERNVE